MAVSETTGDAALESSTWWLTVGVCLAGIAVVSVLGAFAVHQACYHPLPPVNLPIPGTPRADYCGRVEAFHLWPFLIGTPIVLTCLALLVSWRHVRIALALTAIIAVVVLVNAFVVHQLEWSVTI
jgi:hypothetical protein